MDEDDFTIIKIKIQFDLTSTKDDICNFTRGRVISTYRRLRSHWNHGKMNANLITMRNLHFSEMHDAGKICWLFMGSDFLRWTGHIVKFKKIWYALESTLHEIVAADLDCKTFWLANKSLKNLYQQPIPYIVFAIISKFE